MQWLLKSRQANDAFKISALWLALAYLGVGQEAAARASLAEFVGESPRFSIAGWSRAMQTPAPVAAKQRERLVAGLRPNWEFLRAMRRCARIDGTGLRPVSRKRSNRRTDGRSTRSTEPIVDRPALINQIGTSLSISRQCVVDTSSR